MQLWGFIRGIEFAFEFAFHVFLGFFLRGQGEVEILTTDGKAQGFSKSLEGPGKVKTPRKGLIAIIA